MLKTMLFATGAISLLLAVLSVPFGVGEYGALSTRIYSNYAKLVSQGVAKDDPSAIATLMQGCVQSIQGRRNLEAAFLVASGVIQLCCAARLPAKVHDARSSTDFDTST